MNYRILNNDELKFKSQKEFKSYLEKLWKNLDSKEKAKYVLKEKSDKIRFEAVLENRH